MRPEEQTPIYHKAQEIQQIVFSLVELIKESDLPQAREIELELLEDDLFNMRTCTATILSGVKNGSTSAFPYDLRMEAAVSVWRAARDLRDYAYNMEDMGLKDIDYLDILHEEIEELRLLFKEWLKTFELWKYKEDDWGLFSPEGIELRGSEFSDDDDDDDDEYYEEDADDDDDDDDDF